MSERVFVFGMGYTATAFARAIRDRVEWIRGTTRSGEHGTHRFDGDVVDPVIATDLAEATALVVSVPPPHEGTDPVIARFADAIAAAPRLRWIAYLSSVGVYGNYGGAWVSERTTPHPKTERTVRRFAAEKAWTEFAATCSLPLAVFRLAGIYGPGRNAFVNLAEGTAHRVVKPGQVFNRIHVADIAEALAAALRSSGTGIFNLADDEPSPPQDVVTCAAELMGVAPPREVPFASAQLSPMARSFFADNKRVANARIKRELGVALAYPTYREGLAALWRDRNWRG